MLKQAVTTLRRPLALPRTPQASLASFSSLPGVRHLQSREQRTEVSPSRTPLGPQQPQRWINSFRAPESLTYDPRNYKERALPVGRHPFDPLPKGYFAQQMALRKIDRPSAVTAMKTISFLAVAIPPAVFLNWVDPELAYSMNWWLIENRIPIGKVETAIPLFLAVSSFPVRNWIIYHIFRFFYQWRDSIMRPF